jgi:hypothetical protein
VCSDCRRKTTIGQQMELLARNVPTWPTKLWQYLK